MKPNDSTPSLTTSQQGKTWASLMPYLNEAFKIEDGERIVYVQADAWGVRVKIETN